MLPGQRLVTPSGDATGAADLAAVQAAINLVSSGGTVILAPGAYYFNGTATGASHVSLTGSNSRISQVATNTPTFKATSKTHFSITGVDFIGNGTETPWDTGDGKSANNVAAIHLVACTDVEIARCQCTNHAGGDIILEGACENIDIHHNKLVGMGDDVLDAGDNGVDAAIKGVISSVAQTGIKIHHNDISGHCFGLLPTGTVDQVIDGNFVHDIPGQHGMYITQCGQAVITNNVVMDCAQVGIKVQHQIASDVTSAINVSDNTIARCGTVGLGVNSASAGTSNYTTNVLVANNNIYSIGDAVEGQVGLYLSDCKGIVVTGNRIRDVYGYGMQITDCEGYITNNRVAETERCAVAVTTCKDFLHINGLEIVDCPLNTTANNTSGSVFRCAVYLNDLDSPNNKYVHIGNVHARYNAYSQILTPTAGFLQYFVNASANTQVYQTGPLLNDLAAVDNNFAGTLVPSSTVIPSCADTAAPNGCLYYSTTQSALAYKDSSGDVSTVTLEAVVPP